MRALEPGHAYALAHLDPQPRTLRSLWLCLKRWWNAEEYLIFRKRSSRMIDYGDGEHAGTNTQELLRVAIDLCKVADDRSSYLQGVQFCNETGDAMSFIRMAVGDLRQALYSYEVRALRRKRAGLSKGAGKHDDDGDIDAHRLGFKDISILAEGIEELPVGEDGHIREDACL